MSHTPRHRDQVRKHRVIRVVAISVASAIVVALATGFFVYRHLEGNIDSLDVTAALGDDRPEEIIPDDVEHKPLNILLLGSDTREGQDGNIGGDTPGLSDTTILLHVAADRDRAYGVSIPRDLMVERPECQLKDGEGTDPGGLDQFNAAYAIGGPACTIRTVEQMSDVRINHFVVVDFNGFRAMVDALDGVPVCVPEEVNDDIGKIYLPAGSYEVQGQQALSYVRLRHELSENGDIGRMRRQQAFLASMANKAISAGTLVNPVRLYNFLDAATKLGDHRPGTGKPEEARWTGQAAQGHRPGQDPVPQHPVRGLRAGPQPSPARSRRRRHLGQAAAGLRADPSPVARDHHGRAGPRTAARRGSPPTSPASPGRVTSRTPRRAPRRPPPTASAPEVHRRADARSTRPGHAGQGPGPARCSLSGRSGPEISRWIDARTCRYQAVIGHWP